MRKVVVNTTPLIVLSHIGHVDILKKLYGGIAIPQAVYTELSVKTESVCKKAADESLTGFGWIKLRMKWQNLCIKRSYMMER